MEMQSPNAGIGGRTQQAGTLAAATIMPITFQPTLMPRSRVDQALVTGSSTSLNYSLAALIQDSIEALALRGAGRSNPSRADRHATPGGGPASPSTWPPSAPAWPCSAPWCPGRVSGCHAEGHGRQAGGCRPPACRAPWSERSRS